MKYEEIPKNNVLHTYYIMSPSTTKSKNFELQIEKYRWTDHYGCLFGARRMFIREDGAIKYSSYDSIMQKTDNLDFSPNKILLYGELDCERALKIFLERYKSFLDDEEKREIQPLASHYYAYIGWLESELQKIEKTDKENMERI